MKKWLIGISALPALILITYIYGSLDETQIGPAYQLADVPDPVLQAKMQDPFENLRIEMQELPGHDDIVFLNDSTAFASGMDGWIWKLDFATGKASQWVKLPVNPAGLQFAGPERNRLLACASRLGGEDYPEDARVGLYEIELKTREVRPLLLQLPRLSDSAPDSVSPDPDSSLKLSEMNASNSRPFALCNDLAVSQSGKEIYLTEPFNRQKAAMGSGAVPEAIGLYPHGKIWLYDREANSVRPVVSEFTFADGILLDEQDGKVDSIVFTETTKFRMIRAYIRGEKAGQFEVLQENLPGLADGLERDGQGRIWTGLIKKRSGLMKLVHSNPWLKPLLLGLPQWLLPVSKDTGIMVFDSSGKEVLHYSMHDGSRIRDISVAVPHSDRVYFPSFAKDSRGLFSLDLADIPFR